MMRSETEGPVRVRADRNESPLPAPEHVVSAVRSLDGDALRRYPVELLREFESALAERLAVPVTRLAVGSGADDVLVALARAFLEPGDNVVTVRPTFDMYARVATVAGARVRAVPYERRWSLDQSALVRAADRRTRLVFVGHPNNPTTDALDAGDLLRLSRGLPEAIVVVDEVYLALSSASLVPAVALLPNVAVVGSLSKVAALAGMRVGYAVADEKVASSLRRAIPPFPVGVASLVAANAYLRGGAATESFEQRLAAQVSRSLDAIVAGVGPFARFVWRGPANFVLMEFGPAADALVASLAASGIAVRRIEDPSLDGAVRFCALDDPSTDELVSVARVALSQAVSGSTDA